MRGRDFALLSAPRQRSGMSLPSDEIQFERALPSALDAYHDFVESILNELAARGWGQGDLFAVHMALEESISNAIRHGNKQDSNKRVTVECRLSGERFWARICDEGPGFRLKDVPDCCSPECLELPGGRGLALISAYMTRVEYNDCGNCVTLEKRLADAPHQAATADD